jgi:hypothetical protein
MKWRIANEPKETVGDADNWIYLIERFQYGYLLWHIGGSTKMVEHPDEGISCKPRVKSYEMRW